MDHLVLIDGHHLMYRAYWAIPRTLKTKAGEQTNVAFGVASMTLAILAQEEATHVAFCFDAGEETFRHEENETYKDGRAETPDEFYAQIPRVMELVDAFGIKRIEDPKYEADDFLCSYARAAEKEGMRTTIVTGDKDAFQLASDTIRIAVPHKGYQQAEYLGPKEVEEKLGVTPAQVPAYKGLCGDSSDNLPGVKGIGPKGAAQLINQYGSLAGIYEHLDDIKPAMREKLEQDREQAFFCERMAELVCDIPLPVSLADIALKDIDPAPLLTLFHELEFTLLQRRFKALTESSYGVHHWQQVAADVATETESQLSMF